MSSSSQVAESWISAFCSLLGHEYFAEVSEDFIEDDFNLTGLQSQVPMYKEALEMILDVEPEDDEDDEVEEEEEDDEDDVLGEDRLAPYRRAGDRRHVRMASDLSLIESSAELLYGLIHQRYITSRPGIQQMAEKYELQHFGACPRVFCHGAKVLPVGLVDTPGQETVKLFCPSCLDVYTPPNSRFQTVDGAFFGTTFGCLFFMTFPELDVSGRASDALGETLGVNGHSRSGHADNAAALASIPGSINGVSSTNLAPGLGQAQGSVYEPRIYGFRVSERAKSGPRMQWLRDRPLDIRELDEIAQMAAASDSGDDDAAEEDETMADHDTPNPGRRKKAATRTRRRNLGINGTGFSPNAEGSPMEIVNGDGGEAANEGQNGEG